MRAEGEMRVEREIKNNKSKYHFVPYGCIFVILLQQVAKNLTFTTSDKWA